MLAPLPSLRRGLSPASRRKATWVCLVQLQKGTRTSFPSSTSRCLEQGLRLLHRHYGTDPLRSRTVQQGPPRSRHGPLPSGWRAQWVHDCLPQVEHSAPSSAKETKGTHWIPMVMHFMWFWHSARSQNVRRAMPGDQFAPQKKHAGAKILCCKTANGTMISQPNPALDWEEPTSELMDLLGSFPVKSTLFCTVVIFKWEHQQQKRHHAHCPYRCRRHEGPLNHGRGNVDAWWQIANTAQIGRVIPNITAHARQRPRCELSRATRMSRRLSCFHNLHGTRSRRSRLSWRQRSVFSVDDVANIALQLGLHGVRVPSKMCAATYHHGAVFLYCGECLIRTDCVTNTCGQLTPDLVRVASTLCVAPTSAANARPELCAKTRGAANTKTVITSPSTSVVSDKVWVCAMRSPAGDSRTHRDGTTEKPAAAACASSLKEPSDSTKMFGKTSSPLARMSDRVGMAHTRTTQMRVKTVVVATVTVFEPTRVGLWNNGLVCACLRASSCVSSFVCVRVCMCVVVCASMCVLFLCAGFVSECSSCHIKTLMNMAPLFCAWRLSSLLSEETASRWKCCPKAFRFCLNTPQCPALNTSVVALHTHSLNLGKIQLWPRPHLWHPTVMSSPVPCPPPSYNKNLHIILSFSSRKMMSHVPLHHSLSPQVGQHWCTVAFHTASSKLPRSPFWQSPNFMTVKPTNSPWRKKKHEPETTPRLTTSKKPGTDWKTKQNTVSGSHHWTSFRVQRHWSQWGWKCQKGGKKLKSDTYLDPAALFRHWHAQLSWQEIMGLKRFSRRPLKVKRRVSWPSSMSLCRCRRDVCQCVRHCMSFDRRGARGKPSLSLWAVLAPWWRRAIPWRG